MSIFLKGLRQNVLQNKRIGKYLAYALGEIILVVLGILIALQINNWNENRKDKVKETYHLKSLHAEFLKNRETIQQSIKFHKAQTGFAVKVLSIISRDSVNIELDTLHFALLQIGWAWSPNFNDDVWSELLSTGNIGLIKNDSLRIMISHFHSRIEEVNKLNQEWSIYNIQYREVTRSLFPIRLRLSIAESLRRYEIIGQITEPLLTYTEINKRLNKTEQVGPIISDILIVRKVGLIILADLMKECDQIIEMIKKQ